MSAGQSIHGRRKLSVGGSHRQRAEDRNAGFLRAAPRNRVHIPCSLSKFFSVRSQRLRPSKSNFRALQTQTYPETQTFPFATLHTMRICSPLGWRSSAGPRSWSCTPCCNAKDNLQNSSEFISWNVRARETYHKIHVELSY